MTFKPPAQAQEPQPRPDVEVGDHLYVHHQGQPCTGMVKAHGKHGVTVEVDGQHHKVKWAKVLGHKSRTQQRYSVIDQGEDGMLVEEHGGRRRFIATPNESKEDPMVAKSIGVRPVMLFMKAAAPGTYAGGPGLQKKQITDKRGVQTTKWVSTEQGGPQAQKGQHVGFENGAHKGHGEVTASGQHGVTVKDEAGGEHRVHHEKVTHTWGGDGKPDASPHEAEASPAPAASANANKPFFDDADIKDLPDPKKWRHTAFKSWEEAEAKAPEARDQFHVILKGLGQKLGFEEPEGEPDAMTPEMLDSDKSFVFMGPIKKQNKSTKKVNSDYGGDWGGLKDLVRATVAVKSVDDVHNLLAGLKEAGVKMGQRPKDNMTAGTADGYRDINLIMTAPNGMPVELQVQVKAITKAKSEGHEHYNENIAIEQRNKGKDFAEWSTKDRQEFANNRNSQKNIYGRAWATATGVPYKEPVPDTTPTQSHLLQKSNVSNMIMFVKGVKHAIR